MVPLLHAHQWRRPVTSQIVNVGQLLLVIFLQTAGKRLWPFPVCSAQTNTLPYKHFHNTGRKRCIFLTGHTDFIRACYLQKTLWCPGEQSRVHWKWQWPPPGDTKDRQSRTDKPQQRNECKDHRAPFTVGLVPARPVPFLLYWIAKTIRNREGKHKCLLFVWPELTWK